MSVAAHHELTAVQSLVESRGADETLRWDLAEFHPRVATAANLTAEG
jgi:hypothetical protein